MGVFDRQKATAARLISKYGEMVTWRNAQANVPAPDPWNPPEQRPVSEHKVKVVFLPTGGSIHQLIKAMANSDVRSGNDIGYMAPVKFTPSDLDEVVRKDGTVRRIKSIDPIDPNGEGAILYTVEFAL